MAAVRRASPILLVAHITCLGTSRTLLPAIRLLSRTFTSQNHFSRSREGSRRYPAMLNESAWVCASMAGGFGAAAIGSHHPVSGSNSWQKLSSPIVFRCCGRRAFTREAPPQADDVDSNFRWRWVGEDCRLGVGSQLISETSRSRS